MTTQGPILLAGFHPPIFELKDIVVCRGALAKGEAPPMEIQETDIKGTAANKPTLIDSVHKGSGSGA